MEIKELTDSDFARILREGFNAAISGKTPKDNPYLGIQGDYWWTRGYIIGTLSSREVKND